MAAGLQVTKVYIDQKVGSIAVQLRDMIRLAGNVTTTLGVYNQAQLESVFGYPVQDAADLLDALYALTLLVGVAQGTQALPNATNLMVGLSKVTGID